MMTINWADMPLIACVFIALAFSIHFEKDSKYWKLLHAPKKYFFLCMTSYFLWFYGIIRKATTPHKQRFNRIALSGVSFIPHRKGIGAPTADNRQLKIAARIPRLLLLAGCSAQNYVIRSNSSWKFTVFWWDTVSQRAYFWLVDWLLCCLSDQHGWRRADSLDFCAHHSSEFRRISTWSRSSNQQKHSSNV